MVAPEVMRNLCPCNLAAADIWSLGIMLLEMLCGSGKFCRLLGWPTMVKAEEARAAELEAFFAGGAVFPSCVEVDLGAQTPLDLVVLTSKMLRIDPAYRCLAAEVEAAMAAAPQPTTSLRQSVNVGAADCQVQTSLP